MPGEEREVGVGLRAGLGVLKETKLSCPCRESHPGSSSPQPREYNDYATPATIFGEKQNFMARIQYTRDMTRLKILSGQWLGQVLVVSRVRHSGVFCLTSVTRQ